MDGEAIGTIERMRTPETVLCFFLPGKKPYVNYFRLPGLCRKVLKL